VGLAFLARKLEMIGGRREKRIGTAFSEVEETGR
jgi:hypothetical protein